LPICFRYVDLKSLLGAMQQHPQILAVDSKFAAHFILVALVNENLAQQSAVAFGKLSRIRGPCWVVSFVKRMSSTPAVKAGKSRGSSSSSEVVARSRPVVLLQHVITNGVYKGSQAIGLKNFSIA